MKKCLVFQSDFGIGGGGAMYAVCRKVDPELQLYDISHQIPNFDVKKASISLRDNMTLWPKGTVFISVVDPGVGTARKASIAKTSNGYYVSTPDNGSLTYVLKEFGIDEIRVIDENKNRYKGTEKTHIFHGRDLFSYCAAKLAAGVISFEEVGESYPVEDIITFDSKDNVVKEGYVETSVDDVDPFGNVITSLMGNEFVKSAINEGDELEVSVNDNEPFTTRFHYSFNDTNVGDSLVYPNFNNVIGLSVNRGSFAEKYGVKENDTITIRKVNSHE